MRSHLKGLALNKSDLTDNSLETLMRRAQQGDRHSYERLFRTITPILRVFIIRRLSTKADTEDIVQNILLSIHRASHTYDPDRPFKIWMFAIARHRLQDYFRQIYKRGDMPDISLDDLTYEIPAEDVTLEEDRYEYLNRILSLLPERQRRIITMMKLEGYTADDVAKALNMSLSAVKVAAHRAYKTLALRAERE